MFQRICLTIICCFFLLSCEFFQKKELPKDAIMDTIINYNAVDVFPLFPKCDSIPSQQKQKLCTQIKLSEYIYATLSKSDIITTRKVNDTVLIGLRIDNTGRAFLTNIKASAHIQNQIPLLDSLIETSVNELPQLKPAIKRGIPVSTEFSLPIIIVN